MKLLTMWTALLALLCCSASAWAQADVDPAAPGDPLIDWPLQQDPKLEVVEGVPTFHPRLASLWMQAFNQPEAQTRYEAAVAIAAAHAQGMQGLGMTLHRLSQIAASQEEHPMARQAAVKAIIALDARDQADTLLQLGRELGQETTLLVDPALARWQYRPAVDRWKERLADATASLTLRRSAAQSLATAGAGDAADVLARVAQDAQTSPALRLDAAKAYSVLAAGNADAPAVAKAQGKVQGMDALVAVYLLGPHEGQAARQQLAAYAGHSDPAAATIAAQRLLATQPTLLDPLVERFTASGEAALRRIAIERISQRRQASDIQLLAKLLADINPQVGSQARDALIQLAGDDTLKAAANQAIVNAMNNSNTTAVAHAALAAGALGWDHTADTLLKLLDHKDTHVGLAAATALRKLQVESTLPTVLAQVDAHVAQGVNDPQADEAAQLIMLLGLMKHEPARETLVKLVRKNSGPSITRQAAIWALGKLQDGKQDNKLAGQLAARVNDVEGMNPEDDQVRLQAIIALGRFKARNRVTMLQTLSEEAGGTTHGSAARWAIGQITGDMPVAPEPGERRITGWFLEPLD